MLAPDEDDPLRPRVTPLDEHNRALLAHVHPPGWSNPEPRRRYHLVVVGAGTAGLVTAAGAAGLGAEVALVERHLMGGDCLNVGCVPSKALLAAARVWQTVMTGSAFGAPPHIGSGDFAVVMERMRRLRAGIAAHDSARRFQQLGVDVFLGEGRFVSGEAVEVGGKRLRFRRAVVATGGRPTAPPVPGLEEAGYLTNETVFSLVELPRRLAVIGGGPIGCELAQALARFGSQVTLFDVMPRVLPREDPDAAELVRRALERDGIRLELGVELAAVERQGEDTVIRFTREGERDWITADAILVAAGRAPNVEGLGLEEAGVEHTPKGVKVDDRFRTTNPRIYACGDVASPYQFTHAADAQARAVLRNVLALAMGHRRAGDLVIPWCTYTSPEVAHLGLYEEEARQRGIEVETLRVELSSVDRAVLDGEAEGFLKVHYRKGSDAILGATVVAADAGDLLAPLCLAVGQKVGLGKIADTIFPYPTQAEVIKRAADAWNRQRLTPAAKRLLHWRLRLLR
ncbi:MAG TPA: mercuric reductase [Thermoanaerobaculia bacterium]|nr:mercuric reductase [Thermoanaerobaculia bacterium]